MATIDSGNLTNLTFGEIIRGRKELATLSAHALGLAVAMGFFYLEFKSSPQAFDFLEIGASLWLFWELWAHSPKKALPYLPVLLLLVGLFFLMPLLVHNPVLDDFVPATLTISSQAVVVFFGAATLGWLLGITIGRPWHSRFNFDFASAGGTVAGMKLGLLLLSINVLFNALCINGTIWTIVNGDMGLFSIMRSASDISALGGVFLGGLLITRKESPLGWKIAFRILLVFAYAFQMSGLLLFGTVITTTAFSLGVVMGGGVPWRFLAIVACVLAFLNFGKFEMRAKYLDEGGTGVSPTLTGLPRYYMEWADESLRLMGFGYVDSKKIEITASGDEGQKLSERIDQMGSLLFIVDIMRRDAITPLYGATYTLIPPLLIPRYFWPDKPIAHGGQVMLNIYFGRQQTLEQTEKTFVAWGWLPEAIGNFGIWGGAIFIGLFLGTMCGMAEGLSSATRMLSIEGFVLLVFFMTVASSYEMAASIFVTACFQAMCSALVGGIVIYLWMGEKPGANAATAYRSSRGSRKLQPATPSA